MYHHDPTEVWRERQITLLREAEHRRLVRLVREGRTVLPFLGASNHEHEAGRAR